MSAPVPSPPAAARAFRVVAIAEACSWAGLLVGMLFKYVVVGSDVAGHDIGVTVFGPIHGALFVAYVLGTLLTARVLRWDLRTLAIALMASIPPLATLWFERWARRTGRLAPAQPRTDQPQPGAASAR